METEKRPFGKNLVIHTEPKHVYGYLETTDFKSVLDDCPFMRWNENSSYEIGDIDKEYKDNEFLYRYDAKAINAIETEDPNGAWHIPNKVLPAFYITETKIWMIAPFITSIE